VAHRRGGRVHNLLERIGREIVRLEANLQHMRDALGSIFQINTRSPRPIRVFLFDDTKSFAPFRDSLMGRKAKMVAGAFLHGRDAEYILLDAQHHEASENIAYHELTPSVHRKYHAGRPVMVQRRACRVPLDIRGRRAPR